MTKAESVAKLAEVVEKSTEVTLTKKQKEELWETLQETIKETLKEGEFLIMPGFRVQLVTRKQREGVNPSTGEKITIPERRVPVVNCGIRAKEIYNG